MGKNDKAWGITKVTMIKHGRITKVTTIKDTLSRGQHTLIILTFICCDMILDRNDPLPRVIPQTRAVVSKLELIEWNYLL